MKLLLRVVLAAALVFAVLNGAASASTIEQTVQFNGVLPETLYNAYLSSKEHAAMTADGSRAATFYRPPKAMSIMARLGDELRAFGSSKPGENVQYGLTAKVLNLVPAKVIVLSWKTFGWNMASDPSDVSDLESTVVLTFRRNAAGTEVQLV
jgi:uncharacterized protein YndB with AHSA1/START domain